MICAPAAQFRPAGAALIVLHTSIGEISMPGGGFQMGADDHLHDGAQAGDGQNVTVFPSGDSWTAVKETRSPLSSPFLPTTLLGSVTL